MLFSYGSSATGDASVTVARRHSRAVKYGEPGGTGEAAYAAHHPADDSS